MFQKPDQATVNGVFILGIDLNAYAIGHNFRMPPRAVHHHRATARQSFHHRDSKVFFVQLHERGSRSVQLAQPLLFLSRPNAARPPRCVSLPRAWVDPAWPQSQEVVLPLVQVVLWDLADAEGLDLGELVSALLRHAWVVLPWLERISSSRASHDH